MNTSSTLLEELTRDFPTEIKLKLRETLDRTRIRNPDDPIFELMIVLGIWAKYYQGIPQEIRQAGDAVHRHGASMTESLDVRLKLLQTLAQTIQKAVDQLDVAPQVIVDRFPAEEISKSIARKVDDQFRELPLLQVEKAVLSLQHTIESFVEPRAGDKMKSKPSIAQALRDDVGRLEDSADRLSRMDFPDRPSKLRDAVFMVAGGLLMFFVLDWWPDRPAMKKIEELMQREVFLSQRVVAGYKDNRPVIIIPREDFKHRIENIDDIVIYLDRKDAPGQSTILR